MQNRFHAFLAFLVLPSTVAFGLGLAAFLAEDFFAFFSASSSSFVTVGPIGMGKNGNGGKPGIMGGYCISMIGFQRFSMSALKSGIFGPNPGSGMKGMGGIIGGLIIPELEIASSNWLISFINGIR